MAKQKATKIKNQKTKSMSKKEAIELLFLYVTSEDEAHAELDSLGVRNDYLTVLERIQELGKTVAEYTQTIESLKSLNSPDCETPEPQGFWKRFWRSW